MCINVGVLTLNDVPVFVAFVAATPRTSTRRHGGAGAWPCACASHANRAQPSGLAQRVFV